MLTLPGAIVELLRPIGTLSHASTWVKEQILLVGGILALGKLTLTSALRVMGPWERSQLT